MSVVTNHDEIALAEADKYSRMWDHPQYRSYSPGEQIAARALEAMDADARHPTGDLNSILDLGCGTGRASLYFEQRGFDVMAIDHAANCLDPAAADRANGNWGFEFLIRNLWTLQPLKGDYGFCVDVMEHIPTERVDQTLAEIAEAVAEKVFFQISLVPDSCGSLIGEELHMTVRPAEWWFAKIATHFPSISNEREQSRMYSCVAAHRSSQAEAFPDDRGAG